MIELLSSVDGQEHKGSNFAIDGGVPTALFEDYVSSFKNYIDGVKFGWGSGLITPDIDTKIGALKKHDIPFWFGGTAFEISFINGKLDEYVQWVKDRGAQRFEISDGAIELAEDDRRSIINELKADFEVFTEVGSKDAKVVMSPSVWVKMICSDFEAGASKVILEGRESGAAGMYRKDGEVRTGLIDDVELAGVSMENLIFEAPVKSQQVWFIKRFGPQCNLANLPFDAILNVESMRRGLRADTMTF